MHKIVSGRGPAEGHKSYREMYGFDQIAVGDALVLDATNMDEKEIKKVLSNLRSYSVYYKKKFKVRREGGEVVAWRAS